MVIRLRSAILDAVAQLEKTCDGFVQDSDQEKKIRWVAAQFRRARGRYVSIGCRDTGGTGGLRWFRVEPAVGPAGLYCGGRQAGAVDGFGLVSTLLYGRPLMMAVRCRASIT